jgi:hypothetical protein
MAGFVPLGVLRAFGGAPRTPPHGTAQARAKSIKVESTFIVNFALTA